MQFLARGLSIDRNEMTKVGVTRGGSRISEEGVQMWKRGVRLPHFTQNVLKFPMKMK